MTRFRSLLAPVLLLSLPWAVGAADAPPRPKEPARAPAEKGQPSKRGTLQDLIALALKQGTETVLNAEISAQLGLGPGPSTVRRLDYGQPKPGGLRGRAVDVVVDPKADGGRPKAILLRVASLELKDRVPFVDGRIFRCSTAGKLEKAVHNSGKAGAVASEDLPIATKGVPEEFQQELEFHLKAIAARP